MVLIFSSTLSLYSQSRSLGLPFSYLIEPSEYNAGMQNLGIEQDSRGFIYLANNFGLLEFDGAEWVTFPVINGSKVRDIAIAENGKIYTAAQGEFGYFKPNRLSSLSYYSLFNDLPDEHKNIDEVWKVFRGANEVYFCAFNKIFVFFQDRLADVINVPWSENFYFVNNRLYAQTTEEGLQVLFNGEFNPIQDLALNPDETVVSIIKDSENSLLFITNRGRIISSSGSVRMTLQNVIGTTENFTLTTAIRLRNGNIALGTEKNGLLIISEGGNQISHLTKNVGLSSRDVVNMHEDQDGNLWVAHSNGLSVVELGLPFTYISEEQGLPGSGYDAYADAEKLYLATNLGLFSSPLESPALNFNLVQNTVGQSYSIAEINDRLFLGHHTGSYEVINERANLINDDDGMWKVMKDPVLGNKVIAGTYTGLDLLELRREDIVKLKRIPGLQESSRVMEFDEYGNLWMTHGYKGVFKITLSTSMDSIKELRYYGKDEGLPSKEHVNVYKINNKLLFTTIDGIYRYDYQNDSFFKDSVEFNIKALDQPINVLTEDGNGNIYYLARLSMGILKKGAGSNYVANTQIFNKVFGRLNDDLVNVSIINANNILLGAKEGFVIYNPLSPGFNNVEHETYIRQVKTGADEEIIYSGNDIDGSDTTSKIIFSQNSLSFRYSSNFLSDYEDTEYRYFLEGFDESWSGWSQTNSVNYTNLFEGDYVFHVKARNIYDEESTEAAYAFRILPPWYRSKYAYAGYGLGVLFILFLSFKIIDRRYSKSQEQFAREKQQEVDAIGNKLETLSQTTSEEINRLQAEKLEAEVEKKNTELAASTMNLINKNKFISHIKDNLNSITKKSRSAEVKKELGVIMKDIDKNISHDDDWKQFTFHFNNVHGDFTSRLTSEFNNLSSQDIRLCSYLRLNLSTKEIADLLNISVRGVEISRYRLRKKLLLDRSQNLAEFILNY